MRYAICFLFCTAMLAQNVLFRAAREGGDLTPDKVAELENVVAVQPSNEDARARLLGYYFKLIRADLAKAPEEARQARGRHVRWLIENTPRSDLLKLAECFAMSGYSEDSANYAMARELWLEQTERYPSDAKVLSNAVLLLQQRDRLKALQLMKRAYELAAASDGEAAYFGTQLAMSLLGTGGDQVALHDEALRQLETIADPRVIASVGITFVNYTRNRPGYATDTGTEALARKLLKQAMTASKDERLIRACQVQLDRLDGKRRLKTDFDPVPDTANVGFGLRVRVVRSVEAQAALPAAVPAKVMVSVLVGADGTVLEATASGTDAAVRKAAEAAVRNWTFRPTLLYGQPVKAHGVVEVQVLPADVR